MCMCSTHEVGGTLIIHEVFTNLGCALTGQFFNENKKIISSFDLFHKIKTRIRISQTIQHTRMIVITIIYISF